MNARNLTYIRPNNLKRAKRLADDKIKSKKLLKKAGVPVPKLIAKISSRKTLDHFDWSTLPPSFVLKPNGGYGGAGILIVYARKKGCNDAWVKSSGSSITIDDIKNHIINILDGAFSLSGTQDIAFFEERLKLAPELKPYAYRGIPDIRIIVYNRVPVMAMLRLPTKSSNGKANLQLGGIGVGIDIATGTTTTAVLGKGALIDYIPNSRLLLRGIKIPHWDDMLVLAVKAQIASGLGFLGADVALDRDRGPVFLELNARPGLSIQIANMTGLKRRLERVEGLEIKSEKRGVAVGKSLFGGEIEEEVEELSGKKVIGSVEKIILSGLHNKSVEVEAKIDTGAYSTSIDESVACELGFGKMLKMFQKIDTSDFEVIKGDDITAKNSFKEKYKNELRDIPHLNDVSAVFSSSGASIRPVIKIPLTINGQRFLAKLNVVDRTDLTYSAIVGKRNLTRFLVDVSKWEV